MEEIRAGYGNPLIFNSNEVSDKKGNMMGNKSFKVSVSDWEVSFPDGESVVFDALTEETVYFTADGKIKISFKSVTFDKKFLTYFRNEENVVDIRQRFELKNPLGETVEDMEYGYPSMKIKNMKIISKSDEVAEANIVFVNR